MYRYTTQGEFINKSLKTQTEKFTNQSISEETVKPEIDTESLLKDPVELSNEAKLQAQLDSLKKELLNSN